MCFSLGRKNTPRVYELFDYSFLEPEMTENRGGEKQTPPLFQAWPPAGRQAGQSSFWPEMKETLCFVGISFDLGPKWEPAAGLGKENTHHLWWQVGKKPTRPFLA